MIPRSKAYSYPSDGFEKHERLAPTYAVIFNVAFHEGDDSSLYSGFDIERYHYRKRRGDLLPFTQFGQFELLSSRSGSLHYYAPGGYEYQTASNWSHPSSTVPNWNITSAELYDRVENVDFDPYVQQAAANVYSQGWDALTFTAELHKTIALFTGARQRLLQLIKAAINAYKRKNKNSLAKIVLSPTELWLEYRYGWRLLYYDIQDISKALATLDDSRKRFSQRAGTTYTETETTEGTYDGNYKFTYTIVDDYEYSVRGAVVADLTPPKFQFNPITTAWELITFSFIIDWFISVGSWLESLSFLTIQQQYTAAGGVKLSLQRTGTLSNVGWKTGYSGSMSASSEAVGVVTVRTPTTVPLRPLVRLNISIPKVADIVSILASIGLGSFTNLSHRR